MGLGYICSFCCPANCPLAEHTKQWQWLGKKKSIGTKMPCQSVSIPQHQEFKHSNVTVYSWQEYSLFFIYFTLLEIREHYFYASSWYVILSVAVTGKERLSSRLAATVSRGHWQPTLRQENFSLSNFPASGLVALACRTQRCPYLRCLTPLQSPQRGTALLLPSTAPGQQRAACPALSPPLGTAQAGDPTALSRRRYCRRKPETVTLQT